jgi:hypothetical protein
VNPIRGLRGGLCILIVLALTASAGVVGGCASRKSSSSPSSSSGAFPSYNVIRLYNDSPDEIYAIDLDADGMETTLQKLAAEHSPARDRGIRPETQTAEVRWRTAEGRREQQTVQIAGKLPPGFKGVIVLKLKPTGDVETEFVRYEDLR